MTMPATKNQPDQRTGQDQTQNLAPPPEEKAPTLEELNEKLSTMQRVLDTNNAKYNQLQDTLKNKDTMIAELQTKLDRKKAKEIEQQKEQGEFKSLFESAQDEIKTLKTSLLEKDNEVKTLSETYQQAQLKNTVALSLIDKINPLWVGDGLDPVQEALKYYPIEEITVDESGTPTNLKELETQFFKKYPILRKNQSSNVLRPAGQAKSATLDTVSDEIKTIAANSKKPISYVAERLENDPDGKYRKLCQKMGWLKPSRNRNEKLISQLRE